MVRTYLTWSGIHKITCIHFENRKKEERERRKQLDAFWHRHKVQHVGKAVLVIFLMTAAYQGGDPGQSRYPDSNRYEHKCKASRVGIVFLLPDSEVLVFNHHETARIPEPSQGTLTDLESRTRLHNHSLPSSIISSAGGSTFLSA